MNIGIDLGGSHIGVGLVDKNNEIIAKKEHDWIQEEKDTFFESIEKKSKEMIKEIILENNVSRIEKIGIGYPAANIVDGIVTKKGIKLDLPSILSQEFEVPVYLKNDVKCSALCEKTKGNLKEYDNCLFMTLGTGIGGAYFYKNELVTPNKYQGFEIGHMVIEKDGRGCKCGQKGCFEQYASMRVFRKEIEGLFNIEKLTSYKMFEILESKEKLDEVNKIIDRYVENLCIGICNLINIFEPDCICIGGSFAYYALIFIDKLKSKIKESYNNREELPEILIAKYANDAGIIGASMLESN